MVVNNRNDFNGSDLPPVKPPLGSTGWRIVLWDKNQPARMFQINRKLTGTVSGKLMESSGSMSQIFQAGGCLQIVQSAAQSLCHLRSVRLGCLPVICTGFKELGGLE